MKKTEIVGLLVVIILLGFIVSMTVELDDYVTFSDAEARTGETVVLIGKLNTAKPIIYNPSENTSLTKFFAFDNDGKECEVLLHEAKPQGLDRSEEITVTGSFKEGKFHASKMQMKCPSKYEDEKLENLDYDQNKVYKTAEK
jgi:cytochrome c-type biogenesis protein CcmE